MKTKAVAVVAVALCCGAILSGAEEKPAMAAAPQMAGPTKEHALLEQFVGEWESSMEAIMDPSKPDQPPVRCKGKERVRMLGGLWVVTEGAIEMEGMPAPVQTMLTVGYDPEKKKYVGSWVDSMTSYHWKYEGTMDPTGKVLTLETEGPCPYKPGIVKFRDVMEFQSKDRRVGTSSIQAEDGSWQKMVTIRYQRKA